MNTNYVPGETSEHRRERLNREMDEEVVEHKKRIVAELAAMCCVVQYDAERLSQDYLSVDWKVNGHDVPIKSTKSYNGVGMYTYPNGGLRIAIGGYNRNKTFIKKTSAKELKKNPSGFDYKAIAQEVLNYIESEKARIAEVVSERKRKAEKKTVVDGIVERLTAEFGLVSHFGLIPSPLVDESGFEHTLGLKFNRLSETQLRALLTTARAYGVLPQENQENDDG